MITPQVVQFDIKNFILLSIEPDRTVIRIGFKIYFKNGQQN